MEMQVASFDANISPTPPFNLSTPYGVPLGTTMIVEGEVKSGTPEHADRFYLRFTTSPIDSMLIFEARFWSEEGELIVLNSQERGIQQKEAEERWPNHILKDRPFYLEFQFTPNALNIWLRQDQIQSYWCWYTFCYRNNQTPDKIRNICIDGNIQIKRMYDMRKDSYLMNYTPEHQQFSAQWPQTYTMPVYVISRNQTAVFSYQIQSQTAPPVAAVGYGNFSASAPTAPTSYTSVPYAPPNTPVYPPKWLQGGMYNGRHISIHGKPFANADRFSVHLNGPEGNMPLHFSIRFPDQSFVCNAMRSCNWGNEERETVAAFPFFRNQPFKLNIISNHVGYKMTVDGRQIAEFLHRTDGRLAESVSISGHVAVYYVRV